MAKQIKNKGRQSEPRSVPTPIKSLSADIAKDIMNWREIQAPQYDCDGPLPDQGLVLVPPDFDEDNFRGWPNRGVVPYDFFIGNRYSEDVKEALKVVRALEGKGFKFTLSTRRDVSGQLGFVAEFSMKDQKRKLSQKGMNVRPEMAICIAAIGLRSLQKRAKRHEY